MGNVGTKRGRTGGFQGATVNRNGSSVFYPIQKIIIRRTQAWRIGREEMRPVANRYTGNGAEVRVLHSPLSIVEGGEPLWQKVNIKNGLSRKAY